MKIRALFDKDKGIDRPIEKVITYAADSEEYLKREVSEYIVTDHIEDQFRELMDKMQYAMESGNSFEVGVWVSGFYGSGKSSFTKYFGMAMDDSITIDGIPFREHLKDRFRDKEVKAFLNTLPQKFPATVVMHDLASEQISDDPTADVTTILFHKVLQLAGYSRNMKVAAFERKLKKDNRYQEFLNLFKDEVDEEWHNYQNDPLIVDGILPELAHEMYPKLFPDSTSFKSDDEDIIVMTDERVKEMLDIIYEWKGNENVIFVVDEIGQYVGSQQELITNLDGLAKNLKDIGKGNVWIIGTAQQTLTEDNPKAAINSPELYKLKDRFPIQIDLESSDIREISYRRLLEKSPEGKEKLEDLFENYGQSLRTKTKLENAKYYDSQFDKETFVKLYPFLPAHFDILLHLLGQLAKSTGGMGLRSAIKVIQEILKGDGERTEGVANKQVGWLATTETLYDALEKDIKQAFSTVYNSVSNVEIQFPDSQIHIAVAKTVAILQILKNIPITEHNISALLQSSIEGPSFSEKVSKAVDDMISNPRLPFGEQNGSLRFFSEKLNEIEKDRAEIIPRTIELKRIFSEGLKNVFNRLPSVKVHGSLNVQTGMKLYSPQGNHQPLDGDRKTIQTIFDFVESNLYEDELNQLIEESRQGINQNNIFVIARKKERLLELQREIFKSQEIINKHRNDPDSEVKEYIESQKGLESKYKVELQSKLKQQMAAGSIIFRGQQISVDTLGSDIVEALNNYLSEVAETVYDRFKEAPVRASTELAELFLKTDNIGSITEEKDPLNLVQIKGGNPQIDVDQKAIVSIRDYLENSGIAEGKYLINKFSDAPFGWSQDTIRYLIAAMLVAGEIKLRTGGREVTTKGQLAIDALKNNKSFKKVGIGLRDDRPSNEVLEKASERLTKILGDNVLPLEQDIVEKVREEFHQFKDLNVIQYRLSALDLPGEDRISDLMKQIDDVLSSDASDAPQRLGKSESQLYEHLIWARKVKRALDDGLEDTIQELRQTLLTLRKFPGKIYQRIERELAEEIEVAEQRLNSDDFFKYNETYQTLLTDLTVKVREVIKDEKRNQQELLDQAKKDFARHDEWEELTKQEQQEVISSVSNLVEEVSNDLKGLENVLDQTSAIHREVSEQKKNIRDIGTDRRTKRLKEEREKTGGEPGEKISRKVQVPDKINNRQELEELIKKLQRLKSEMELNQEIDVEFELNNR